MRFAVFLDVDGVLNTRTTCESTPNGFTGIDTRIFRKTEMVK